MSYTVYRTRCWDEEIEECQAEKHTPKCIWIIDSNLHGDEVIRKKQKFGNYTNYFTSREAAVEYLRERCEREVENSGKRLSLAKKRLAEFEETYGS